MSSSILKVGVKFCGNCNPHVSTGDIYRKIKDKVKNMDGFHLVPKDTPGLDVLIVLSGCPADCAERPPGEYQEIVAAGETVNRVGCTVGEIEVKVLDQLVKAYGKKK